MVMAAMMDHAVDAVTDVAAGGRDRVPGFTACVGDHMAGGASGLSDVMTGLAHRVGESGRSDEAAKRGGQDQCGDFQDGLLAKGG